MALTRFTSLDAPLLGTVFVVRPPTPKVVATSTGVRVTASAPSPIRLTSDSGAVHNSTSRGGHSTPARGTHCASSLLMFGRPTPGRAGPQRLVLRMCVIPFLAQASLISPSFISSCRCQSFVAWSSSPQLSCRLILLLQNTQLSSTDFGSVRYAICWMAGGTCTCLAALHPPRSLSRLELCSGHCSWSAAAVLRLLSVTESVVNHCFLLVVGFRRC